MPRVISHEQYVATMLALLQLVLNSLLFMMGDSQPTQLSAVALAALGQELWDYTERDMGALYQRQQAAAQAAEQRQGAEAQGAAEQRRDGTSQQGPSPGGQRSHGAPEAAPSAQQPASPQRPAKRTLKAYRQQRDELQPPTQGLADKPMLLDTVLREVAPRVAACMTRPGLLDALDRCGHTAPCLHLWRMVHAPQKSPLQPPLSRVLAGPSTIA
jgi:hypothetical protein